MKRGFTLLEISIILIVIGIITSAIFASRNIIRASGLKTIITELQLYKNAALEYYEKYGYYPGDDPNYINLSSSNVNYKTWDCGACWGNGDFIINTTATNNNSEWTRVWQHLSLSGILQKGSYNGTARSIPCNNWSRGCYGLTTILPASPVFATSGQTIQHGALDSTNATNLEALSALDAYYIDSKIDDGFANNGDLYGYSPNNKGGCSIPATSADYNFSIKTEACILLYWVKKDLSD